MATYTSTILITGGTQGMGYHCTSLLARSLPQTRIVIASRTDPRNAAATINKSLNQSNVQYMPLDLDSLSKVRDFAKGWKDAQFPPIQALVMNAAGQWPDKDVQYTPDGIEKHLGVNCVGHALLFHLLVKEMKSDARIIVVSSSVHDIEMGWGLKPDWTTTEEAARPTEQSNKGRNGMDRYATSKLANVLWMLALSRHITSHANHANKSVVALDPGLMPGTGLARNGAWLYRFVVVWVLPKIIPLMRKVYHRNIHTPEESGAALAWLVTAEGVGGRKGVYFEGKEVQSVSKVAMTVELQEELWEWTVEKVSEGRDEKDKFARLE